jgi:hypothetical protein
MLLRMYLPRNWKFGSALSKLRNFGGGGVLNPLRYATDIKVLGSLEISVSTYQSTWFAPSQTTWISVSLPFLKSPAYIHSINKTIRTTRLKTRARTRSPVSGAMSLPNCTRVLRKRFILPSVRPLLLVPCRCESKSDSDRAADGGNGGLRLPAIYIKLRPLLIAKISLTKTSSYLGEDVFIYTFLSFSK